MLETFAKVIEDSISPHGVRLTTMQLCYPRLIHAEAKTHRILSQSGEEYEVVTLTQDASFMSDRNLSRNASSSRAIPVAKMIEQVRTNPAMPIHWGANQPGMQARAEVDDVATAKILWRAAANDAADNAEAMMNLGLHKQVANRILEPFQFIHVVVTATEWDNFFELRDHPDADPNIAHLAELMRFAQAASIPDIRDFGRGETKNWHLPYVTAEERATLPRDPLFLAKLSTARNARVSYLTHDGRKPDQKKDLELYDRLVGSTPLHASPVEHIATPAVNDSVWSGNFRGWRQFRKQVELEMAAS